MSATKAQSQKIFEKLKTKPANRVKAPRQPKKPFLFMSKSSHANSLIVYSYALTADLRIQHGHRYLLVFTYAWTVRLIIVTSVSISPSFAPQTSTVCLLPFLQPIWSEFVLIDAEWQWEQLRVMKVGGNESATKFFQSHGGSAALASKDPHVKYESNAAVKYKEELKRRAAQDAKE